MARSPIRIDVYKSRELLATIYAIRSIDKTLTKIIRRETKRIAQPEWVRALGRRASTALERRVLVDTAVVTVSDNNVRLASASKGRKLSGGLNPKEHWGPVERGLPPKDKTYGRKGRAGNTGTGKPHEVTRKVGTAFRPRNNKGYVFLPSAREMVPRIAALWVQTTVRTIANALEGKQE